jgi:hypothetical protein
MATASILSGCGLGEQPLRQLTKAELEADMADRLKLRDVTLTDERGGRFTGTGKGAEGKPIELAVTQREQRRSWKTHWKGPNGEASGEGAIAPWPAAPARHAPTSKSLIALH